MDLLDLISKIRELPPEDEDVKAAEAYLSNLLAVSEATGKPAEIDEGALIRIYGLLSTPFASENKAERTVIVRIPVLKADVLKAREYINPEDLENMYV